MGVIDCRPRKRCRVTESGLVPYDLPPVLDADLAVVPLPSASSERDVEGKKDAVGAGDARTDSRPIIPSGVGNACRGGDVNQSEPLDKASGEVEERCVPGILSSDARVAVEFVARFLINVPQMTNVLDDHRAFQWIMAACDNQQNAEILKVGIKPRR